MVRGAVPAWRCVMKALCVLAGLALLVCLTQHARPSAATELLINPNFEKDFKNNWYCNNCVLSKVQDGLAKSGAAKVTGRWVLLPVTKTHPLTWRCSFDSVILNIVKSDGIFI